MGMSRARALLLAVVLALPGLGACSGSSAGVGTSASSGGAAADLGGAWSGTWTSTTGVSGAVDVVMRQSGSTLDGDVHFTRSPCFASGHFSGTVSGRDFSGSVTAGAIRVDMSGTVTGDAYDGTYSTVQAGACTGDTGTFSAER